MAEPQPERPRPLEDPESTASISRPLPAEADGQIPLGEGEVSDDAPTIITRPANRPARPDEEFPVALRGRRLAHFELLEAIGVGGMAAVIRAQDTQLDRTVALKILPPETAADPEIVRRFHQEARAAAKLDHENIARVFFCGEDQGLHFIAFEFVEGENLRTILERRGPLPVAEAVHYLLQVATGLAHSAARGVVHRDIKPSNIIVSANGRAKLVDMGLARSLEPQGDLGLTQSGVTLGTFDYISPEQALEPRDADVRSDIYSLGCTFYHMLTGRPPVPEGTAAKKLHHHQHVAPLDPRQLNPDIPDEVAAVLARMMAKDPQHRYQRAEHLVQHLLQLARQLGAAPEVPDGVLFVDTPLPSPPTMRPVLVGVIAAGILVSLVVLHSLSPWSRPAPTLPKRQVASNGTPADGSQGAAPNAQASPPPASPSTPPKDEPRLRPPLTVTAARDLAEALRDNPPAEVFLAADIDLRDTGGLPGLVFRGQGRQPTLVLQPPKDFQGLKTIRLKYDPDLHAQGPKREPVWAALTVKGGHVTVRRIRFEVNATQAQIRMMAVKLERGARLTLEQCEFVQVDPPRTELSPDASWLSSLVVNDAHAELQGCYFGTAPGSDRPAGIAARSDQRAITLDGTAKVKATSCAFGPHTVLFHLGKGAGPGASLSLLQCSALLKDTTAFEVDNGVACRLDVEHSLFSHPNGARPAGGLATLIEEGDDCQVHFEGRDNRYHNLSRFWAKAPFAEPKVAAALADFQRELAMRNGKDAEAQTVSQSPWVARDPLELLKKGELRDLAEAFRLDEHRRDLRQSGADNNLMVGVDPCAWGRTYVDKLPPLEDQKPAVAAVKIVDPKAPQTGNGVYRKLSLAIGDAQPGDEIQIRANGLVPVEPIKLDQKTTSDLTLKPAPGFHPVLTLGETSDPDAALFRVHDGKLRVEGLEFFLRPQPDEVTAQAVVDLIGDGQCLFKGCVVTLDDPKNKPLALVMLSDPGRVMKMEPAPPRKQPRVSLENCFVRGQGDLIAVRACRPLELKMDGSLVALTGSFLSVEGSAKEPPAAAVQVKLHHDTIYLNDHLVRLRADREGKEPVPVQINPAENCLFAAAESKALIHLDGLDVTPEQMRHLFSWENGQKNAYSKFQPMLDQQPRGEEMPLQPYDQQRWKSFTGESDGLFLGTPGGGLPAVKFAEPPASDVSLAKALVKALPSHFRVKTDTPQGYGANVEQLPEPFPDLP